MIRLFGRIVMVFGILALLAVCFARDTTYRFVTLYRCAGKAQWDSSFDSSFIADCMRQSYGAGATQAPADAKACVADFIFRCMGEHGYEMIPKDSCTGAAYGAYDMFCWRKAEAPRELRMPFYPERK